MKAEGSEAECTILALFFKEKLRPKQEIGGAESALAFRIVSGARSRFHPLFRFKDAAKRDMVAPDIPSDNWEDLAENQPGWMRRLRNGGIRLDKEWLAKSSEKDRKYRPLANYFYIALNDLS